MEVLVYTAGSDGIARSTRTVTAIRGAAPRRCWCRGVAPRIAVTVPVSPSNRVEFHDWDSAGHSAPESTISAGYDWSNATVGKLREQSQLVYLRSIAYLSNSY